MSRPVCTITPDEGLTVDLDHIPDRPALLALLEEFAVGRPKMAWQSAGYLLGIFHLSPDDENLLAARINALGGQHAAD